MLFEISLIDHHQPPPLKIRLPPTNQLVGRNHSYTFLLINCIVHQSVEMVVPPIYSDEPFEDRKSVFQAHLSPVHNKEEVQLVLNKLKENKKIANATHNMYAYR